MISYDDHAAFLAREEEGYRAERIGFWMAKQPGPPPPYSTDEYLQMRYESGLADGRAKLELQEVGHDRG